MALWHRLRPAGLAALSRRQAGWHPSPQSAVPAARPEWRAALTPLESPPGLSPAARGSRLFDYAATRSFAAPVQAKTKPAADDSPTGPRLNSAITAPLVRLVSEEGHCIVSRREALDRATKLNLDLVEVQRNANPPVCKIMDFHKEKFLQEVKEKERAKSKSAITLRGGDNKEVRFKAKTELKDLKIKAEAITRLMERGHRVKCTAMSLGKENEDLGGLLSRLLALIEDVSVVESGPHVDTSKAYVIVRHAKFTTKKSGKKVNKIMDTMNQGVQNAVSTMPEATNTPSQDDVQTGEEWEQVESSSDAESDVLSAFAESAPNGASKESNGWSGYNIADGYGGKMDNGKSLHQKLPDASIMGGSYLNQRPSAFKEEFNLPRAKQGLQTEIASKRINDRFVSSQPEPFVGGNNRYSRQSKVPPNPNQGRMPQQPRTNVREGGQPDPRPRQRHPNIPSPQSPNSGISSTPGTANSGLQRNLGDRTVTRPSNIMSPAPRFGNFISQKSATDSGDKRHLGESNMGKPSDSSSPTPSYGIFSNSKTIPSGDQRNQGDATSGKPINPNLSSPSYGIFSATNPSSSGDEKNLKDANVGKLSDSTTTPTPRYGIFSTTKSAASSDHRS